MSNELPPLPEPHILGSESDDGLHHFTSDQMRSYASAAVAAERERCAKLCDVSADVHWGAWDEHADPTDQGAAMEAERLALEIRGPNANLTG